MITETDSLNDERLIREGEAAVQEYGRSIDRACGQIIPMARGLLAARRRYRADQDFGNWLEQSPYSNVGHTDRAALIKIGEHESFIIKFMPTTTLTSPQLLWKAYSEAEEAAAVSYDRKPAKIGELTSEAFSCDRKTAKMEELTKTSQKATLLASPEETARSLPSDTRGDEAQEMSSSRHRQTTKRAEKTKKAALSAPPDNYIAAVEKFIDETTAARARVGEFSPKAAARVMKLIDWIKDDLGAMQQELRLKIDSEMELSQATQH